MATITAAGVGSGLDINNLVAQLVAAEGQPAAERLDRKEAGYQATLSALGSFKGGLADLQSRLEALTNTKIFEKLFAASGNPDLFSAAVGDTAVAGRYEIEVTRLAQTHKLASQPVAADGVIGGGAGDSLTVVTGSASFTLDLSSGMTLAELRDAINDAAGNSGPAVTAAVVTTDGGDQGLVLTAAETGYDNRIELTFGGTLSGAELGMNTANVDSDGSFVTDLTKLDAALVVDGYAVTRSGNTVTDVIEGVTLNLVGTEPGVRTSLTVALDRGAVSSKVQDFVASYNALLGTMRSLSRYDAETQEAGVLLGDATLRTLGDRLRQEIGRVAGEATDSFRMLTDIGITSSTDGTLTLDASKLEAALDEDAAAVRRMFAGESGVAVRLDAVLESYVQTGGILDTRTSGLEASIDDIARQRTALDDRLVALEARYMAQFTALDALVSQLTATGDFLAQQLAALPGAYDPKGKD